MMATKTEPRAWIGSLAAYNAGRLVGAWIDLDSSDDAEHVAEQARDAMRTEIDGWMTEAQAFDELWVFDHEGLGGLVNGECGIAEAFEAAGVMAEIEDYEADAFAAYLSYMGPSNTDRDSVVDDFRDCYRGGYDSLEAFAAEVLDETGALEAIPENLRAYFDYAAYGRDLRLGGEVWTAGSGGSVFVFWNQ